MSGAGLFSATAIRKIDASDPHLESDSEGNEVQTDTPGGNLREDAKQLLRVAYERQAMGESMVTQIDLLAGAAERGLAHNSLRLAMLVDYMEVMGWLDSSFYGRDSMYDTTRGITARGLEVVSEG